MAPKRRVCRRIRAAPLGLRRVSETPLPENRQTRVWVFEEWEKRQSCVAFVRDAETDKFELVPGHVMFNRENPNMAHVHSLDIPHDGCLKNKQFMQKWRRTVIGKFPWARNLKTVEFKVFMVPYANVVLMDMNNTDDTHDTHDIHNCGLSPDVKKACALFTGSAPCSGGV
jgi:hypothetical protein